MDSVGKKPSEKVGCWHGRNQGPPSRFTRRSAGMLKRPTWRASTISRGPASLPRLNASGSELPIWAMYAAAKACFGSADLFWHAVAAKWLHARRPDILVSGRCDGGPGSPCRCNGSREARSRVTRGPSTSILKAKRVGPLSCGAQEGPRGEQHSMSREEPCGSAAKAPRRLREGGRLSRGREVDPGESGARVKMKNDPIS